MSPHDHTVPTHVRRELGALILPTLQHDDVGADLGDAVLLARSVSKVIGNKSQLRAFTGAKGANIAIDGMDKSGFRGSYSDFLALFKGKDKTALKREIKKLKGSLKKLKSSDRKHPLYPLWKASNGGRDDTKLIGALMGGLGPVSVIETLIVPKAPLKQQGKKFYFPSIPLTTDRFDFKGARAKKLTWWRDAYQENESMSWDTKRMMTGFTKAEAWEWSKRISFPSGHFVLKAGAYYTVGFRVPVKFMVNTHPNIARYAADKNTDKLDQGKFYLQAVVDDENSRYYDLVNLKGIKNANGAEIPLRFGAYVKCSFRALWKTWLKESNCRKGIDIDYSVDVKVPYGKRNTVYIKPNGGDAANLLAQINLHPLKRGTDPQTGGSLRGWFEAVAWVPPSLTKTEIPIRLGSIRGRAYAAVGLKFGGTGKVTADIKREVWKCSGHRSCRKTGSNTTSSTPFRKVTFTGKGERSKTIRYGQVRPRTRTFKYEKTKDYSFPPLGRAELRGKSAHAKLTIKDPKYSWNVTITPGAKIYAGINIPKPWGGKWRPRFGPKTLWLDAFAVNLGEITLNRHAGTPNQVEVTAKKTFGIRTGEVCVLGGSKIAMADDSQRAIESLRVGDRVLAYDTKAKRLVPARVTQTFVHENTEQVVMINDGLLGATDYHRVYAGGQWHRADALQAGQPLLMLSAVGGERWTTQQLPVQNSVLQAAGGVTTYNLAVDGPGNFFANGVLVESE